MTGDTDIRLRLLDNVLAAAEDMTVGKRTAEVIVGGRRKLERLHVSGKVRCAGKGSGKNGKWSYNMADVLRHCKRRV